MILSGRGLKISIKVTSHLKKFYERNYLKYIPENREISILVVSCGPGYLLNVLKKRGYRNIFGIDSDPRKNKICQGKWF